MYYGLKVLLTAGLVVAVSEASKRSSLLGGLLASLPLVSFLGMIWLYIDTGSTEKVAELSKSVFWLVLPSLPFFRLSADHVDSCAHQVRRHNMLCSARRAEHSFSLAQALGAKQLAT